jgi:hypothetical protein
MVFVRNDKIFAKVWKIDKKDKYADLRISTSEKIEKDGETSYINSNWFARAVGKAFNQLKDINEGDRVVITKAKLSNEQYEKDLIDFNVNLTKAKEIIQKLQALYFSPVVTNEDVKRQDEILAEAEQFLKEISE